MCDETKIVRVLKKIGFVKVNKIADTLQGSIWRAQSSNIKDNTPSVFKIADQALHKSKLALIDGKQYMVNEDILLEQSILKYLTQNKQCPPSIVKFNRFFKSRSAYYLEMEDGGSSLFEFIQTAHDLLKEGKIKISEWRRVVKVLFKQMIEAIEYIHGKNICHFDISLENFLINDVDIVLEKNQSATHPKMTVKFLTDTMQIKLCDFGLAQIFTKSKCVTDKFCGKRQYKSPEVNKQRKKYDGKANDIWCVGVCLFVMMFGGFAWDVANKKDDGFNCIMNGYLIKVLETWGRLDYVDDDLMKLFHGIFQYEQKRMNLSQIKENQWLK